MDASLSAPKTLAVPPRPRSRNGLWALPLVLSLLFVAGVVGWLVQSQRSAVEDQRLEMISDSLTLEAQISSRIESESQRLHELGLHVDKQQPSPQAFASMPEVLQGLHRFWLSVTWLDANNRILVHLPEQQPRSDIVQRARSPSTGVSAHLSATLPSGAAMVVRYSPSEMLRQGVPWWLARKYDVQLVDTLGTVIASTGDARGAPDRPSYRVAMSPILSDTYLELVARDRVAPWYGPLTLALIGGFVVLIAASTVMLRRQVREVSLAEEAWRTEAAWRSAMEESLTVGLRARDLEGRLLYVNRALAAMVGHRPEDLVGLLPPMPYWPHDSLEATMQRHQRTMAGEAPREGYEAVWRHRDGRHIDVMIFEAPLVDSHGRHIGWMGSILDITERKRLEDRERRQTESMAHHARLTMLGEVASTLAHELNQPLSAISSYTAGVANSLQRHGWNDPVVLRALQRLGEQAAHAGAIVQRIREFLTRRAPRLEHCDMNAVARGAVNLLRRELHRHHVDVHLRLDEHLPSLVADHVLMEQVIVNLVRNASDALGAQPGARHIELRTSLSADQRFVRVDVRDNGPGLEGQRIETLCAPFYSTKAEGMGMGLAICRSIIEAHHGVFAAETAHGGGALFSLTLPLDLQPVDADEEQMA
ncbi:MAG TPA: PAS domain S-box protein [Albitalea sp.]|nr:PAS domain S-box protein [Albitalea sp.]